LNDRGNEAVASPRQCLYISGSLCGVGQCLPQFVDRLIEIVLEVNESFFRPQLLLNLFPRHHLPGTLQQHHQDVQGLTGKPDL
jgi:hypothetical protein